MATAIRKPKAAPEQSPTERTSERTSEGTMEGRTERGPDVATASAERPDQNVSAGQADGLVPGTGSVAAHSMDGDGSANDQSLGDHDEAVRQAAYRHFLDRSARGETDGSAEQDWLRAEAEIRSAGKQG